MPKALWFLLGFVLALVILVGLLAGPILRGDADILPKGAATGLTAPTTPPEALPEQTPPAAGPLLSWLRQSDLPGQCARLELDAQRQAHYGPCDEGPRLAYLTAEELSELLTATARYAPFDYAVQQPVNDWSRTQVTLSWRGQGGQETAIEAQAALAAWAQRVYTRLENEERHADLAAAARGHLARRLMVAVEEIQVTTLREVTWPDSCLGLHQEGVFCAQVATSGYQLTLTAGGHSYEYRADTYGTLRSADPADPRLLLPPLSE